MDNFKPVVDALITQINQLKLAKAKLDSDKEYLLREKANISNQLKLLGLASHAELKASISQKREELTRKSVEIGNLLATYNKAVAAPTPTPVAQDPKVFNQNLTLDEI